MSHTYAFIYLLACVAWRFKQFEREESGEAAKTSGEAARSLGEKQPPSYTGYIPPVLVATKKRLKLNVKRKIFS